MPSFRKHDLLKYEMKHCLWIAYVLFIMMFIITHIYEKVQMENSQTFLQPSIGNISRTFLTKLDCFCPYYNKHILVVCYFFHIIEL